MAAAAAVNPARRAAASGAARIAASAGCATRLQKEQQHLQQQQQQMNPFNFFYTGQKIVRCRRCRFGVGGEIPSSSAELGPIASHLPDEVLQDFPADRPLSSPR